MTKVAWVGIAALLLTLGACGDDDGSSDVDSGPPEEDSGMDAGASVLDCEGSVEDVYVTPEGLPEFTDASRGEVVRCAVGEPLTADEVQRVAALQGWEGPALTSGVQRYYLSFRTPRASGEGAFSSAILYLPIEMPASPKPLVVVAHPTTGMGDICAPSRSDLEDSNMQDVLRELLPIVGNGHPVIAPDYVGLGTEGTHGFLVAEEAAHTVLDSIRAARQIAPEGYITEASILVGYSQGGHAVLAAQAAHAEYAPELEILGVSAAAPPWVDLRPVGLLLSAPSEPINGTANFASMYFVGTEAAYHGETDRLSPIDADKRDAWDTLYTENCHDGQVDRLGELATNVGDLFSSGFSDSVAKCVNLGICDTRGEFWRDRLDAHRPELDMDGPPIRIQLGTLDDTMNYRSVSCDFEELRDAGLDVELCIFEDVLHTDMSVAPMEWNLDWLDAVTAGTDEPTCLRPTPCGASADGGVSDGGVADGGVADGG